MSKVLSQTKDGIPPEVVTFLRYNKGMLRDCWWETVENERILVIRQTNLLEPPKTKQIRLTVEEVKNLVIIIGSELNK